MAWISPACNELYLRLQNAMIVHVRAYAPSSSARRMVLLVVVMLVLVMVVLLLLQLLLARATLLCLFLCQFGNHLFVLRSPPCRFLFRLLFPRSRLLRLVVCMVPVMVPMVVRSGGVQIQKDRKRRHVREETLERNSARGISQLCAIGRGSRRCATAPTTASAGGSGRRRRLRRR